LTRVAGDGQQYDPTITSGLALSDIVYKDFAVTGDSAFHWWVALASSIGCDPRTTGCATSVNGAGRNDALIYYDPNYASNGNQTLSTPTDSGPSSSTTSTRRRRR